MQSTHIGQNDTRLGLDSAAGSTLQKLRRCSCETIPDIGNSLCLMRPEDAADGRRHHHSTVPMAPGKSDVVVLYCNCGGGRRRRRCRGFRDGSVVSFRRLATSGFFDMMGRVIGIVSVSPSSSLPHSHSSTVYRSLGLRRRITSLLPSSILALTRQT
jgi:hypothetical protein